MHHVLPDGAQESLIRGSVEQFGLDRLPSVEQSREEPVHPVDDPHRLPVHQYGRKRRVYLRECRDVVLLDPFRAQRLTR
ncbi:hypothetical protein [Streptomyces fungicidicus]|uniref:hypothetical protein n=1 Tax=Streptomyces fungicidicus TaxID=68203 RepID=UPI003804C538